MNKPYALLSDLHLHSWSTFSDINGNGVNTRLQTIIGEVFRAKHELVKAGGDTMILAGDIFHTRGSISPEVLNPVIDMFQELCKDIRVYAIPGNHDLSSKNTSWLTNAASSLEPAGVIMANKPMRLPALPVLLIPWHNSTDELKAVLEDLQDIEMDVIIHAPVDGVINGLPDHGLTDSYLATLDYNRVFSGHYHNFKDFGNDVYSIGATTHQTWSDVGSKAGFLLVDDKVKRLASHAPLFVDIYGDMDEEELLACDGNYVRVKVGKATPAEVNDLRKDLLDRGAKGVVIQAIKETEVTARGGKTVGASITLEQSVADYIGDKFGGDKKLANLCRDILSDVEEV